MWDQMFKRWLDLVFWWLPKHEATQQPSTQTPEPAPETAPEKAPPHAAKPAAAQTEVPAPAQTKQPAAERPPEPATRRQPAATERAPDDLTVIKGIGPAVQQKLHALGIKTFDDLAAADPEALAEQLKGRQPISQARVRGWTEAADQQTAARH